MTIQRIGTSEGVKDIPGIKVMPIISYAVVHNGIVSLCGITAQSAGDVKVQTKEVLESIDKLLQMAGTDKSKLLSAQVWLADMHDFDDHNSVWNDWVDRQKPPVRACVGAPLWRPGILVEIMVTAAK
jgi:enamine deaminase RidA (YjgF/YER057c/UK114 family)